MRLMSHQALSTVPTIEPGLRRNIKSTGREFRRDWRGQSFAFEQPANGGGKDSGGRNGLHSRSSDVSCGGGDGLLTLCEETGLIISKRAADNSGCRGGWFAAIDSCPSKWSARRLYPINAITPEMLTPCHGHLTGGNRDYGRNWLPDPGPG